MGFRGMSAAAIVRPSSANRLNVEHAFRFCVIDRIIAIVRTGQLGKGRTDIGKLTESMMSS